jgi:hypothetical protein
MLQAVAAAHPNYQVRLVVGSDIVADGEIQRWRNYEKLAGGVPADRGPADGLRGGEQLRAAGGEQHGGARLAGGPDNPAAREGLAAAVPAVVLERLHAGTRGHVWLIGHGNVARHAEAWLMARGWTSTLISARGLVDGSEELPGMASRPNAAASGPVSRVPKVIWILCKDQHLGAVAQALAGCGLRPVPVLHAAGSQPAREGLAPLVAAGFPVGTLHPICSLRRELPRGACWIAPASGSRATRRRASWRCG